MRLVPHHLTAIVSIDPSSPLPSGLLVSSFNTVTLSPIPMVSFNIKLPSSTYTAIRASRSFTASAINSAPTARMLVDGRPDHVVATSGRLKMGAGGVWWMRCTWVPEKSMEVGDHMIVVGEVMETGKYGEGGEGRVVVYLNGGYRSLDSCLNSLVQDRS